MTIDRRVLAGTLGLALIVAACGGSAASPGATASPAQSQAAASSAPASVTPTATADQSTGPEPSFTAGAASDLEAMLPDSAGGVTFTKQSFNGADLGAAGVGVDTGDLDPILKANGKTFADVRAAIAAPATASATNTAMIFAIQIQGVDATQLVPLLSSGQTDSSFTSATIGGKQVLKSGAAGFNNVIYTKGDVLFDVFLASDSVLEAVLAALP